MSAMYIVGITGPIGHGKTTFAMTLDKLEPASRHFESWHVVAQVAEAWQAQLTTIPSPQDLDAINQWLHQLAPLVENYLHIPCTFDQLRITAEAVSSQPIMYDKLFTHLTTLSSQPELAHEPITEANKEVFRPLLQWLGGYLLAKVDSEIWYKEIVCQIRDAQARGATLCTVGGVRFLRDAAVLAQAGGVIVKIYRPDLQVADLKDPTERERDHIKTDSTIVNNGNLEELAKAAQHFYQDLVSKQLQPEYRAH